MPRSKRGAVSDKVALLARECALRFYQKHHPGVGEEEAWPFAARNWRRFIPMAREVLEGWATIDANADAAPHN